MIISAAMKQVVAMLAIFMLQCDAEELKPSISTHSELQSSNDQSHKGRNPRNVYDLQNLKMYIPPKFQTLQPYKRVPSGFFGVRGKKQFDGYEETDRTISPELFGLNDGIFPSTFDQDYPLSVGHDANKYEISKRGTFGFLGMRGKKLPGRSSFFGMRGKKYPYQFRGKFVGVRGKKSSRYDYDNKDFAELAQQLDLNQLMLLLTANDYDFLSENNENNNII